MEWKWNLVGVVGRFGIDHRIRTATGVAVRTIWSRTSYHGGLQRQISIQLEQLIDATNVDSASGRIHRQVAESSSATGWMAFVQDGSHPLELVDDTGVAAFGTGAGFNRRVAADGRVRKRGCGGREQREEEQRPAHCGVAGIAPGRNGF